MRASVLITAAGRSRRMGAGPKKEYRLLDGIPVLEHIVALFLELNRFSRVAVTCPRGEQAQFEEILADYISDRLLITEGSGTRQESVFRGLCSLADPEPAPGDVVLIHDGARPWASPGLICRIAEMAAERGSALPVVPATNAMKRINNQGEVEEHLSRQNTAAAQTPQGFRFAPILEAHRLASGDPARKAAFIDDSEIYQTYIGPVHTLPGEPENRKITYPADLSPRENPSP